MNQPNVYSDLIDVWKVVHTVFAKWPTFEFSGYFGQKGLKQSGNSDKKKYSELSILKLFSVQQFFLKSIHLSQMFD
jgi:hypothetical protein